MNALILSAGLGSRINELTKELHKALIPINGKPMLEYTIDFLVQAQVEKIFVVVGYFHEQFAYLTTKYPQVELVFNESFDTLNNAYSFYKGLVEVKDTWVLEADLLLQKNVFLQPPMKSTYFLIKRDQVGIEWVPVFEQDLVVDFKIEKTTEPSHGGISFWKKEAFKKIKDETEWLVKHQFGFFEESKNYWDHIPMRLLADLEVQAKILDQGSCYEIDSYQDFLYVKEVMSSE